MLEFLGCLACQLVAEVGQRLVPAVEQDDPHRGWVKGAELAPKTARRELPNLAGELHPGRSRPYDRDGQPALTLGLVVRHLRYLEGAEDPAPQFQRIVDRLHAGRVQRVLGVTEVRLVDTGGDDEAVVWDLELLQSKDACVHDAPLQIEPSDLRKPHPHVLVLAYHVPDRRRDLTGRKQARCHLIQQGLEQVVVAPVDQGDIDRLAAQPPGGGQPAEPTTNDHDSMTGIAV